MILHLVVLILRYFIIAIILILLPEEDEILLTLKFLLWGIVKKKFNQPFSPLKKNSPIPPQIYLMKLERRRLNLKPIYSWSKTLPNPAGFQTVSNNSSHTKVSHFRLNCNVLNIQIVFRGVTLIYYAGTRCARSRRSGSRSRASTASWPVNNSRWRGGCWRNIRSSDAVLWSSQTWWDCQPARRTWWDCRPARRTWCSYCHSLSLSLTNCRYWKSKLLPCRFSWCCGRSDNRTGKGKMAFDRFFSRNPENRSIMWSKVQFYKVY